MQQIRVNASLSASGDGESRRRFPGIPHFTNIIQSIPALHTSPPSTAAVAGNVNEVLTFSLY